MVSFLSLYKNTQINNVLENIFILAHGFRGVYYIIGWLGISWSMVRQNMAARTPYHHMLQGRERLPKPLSQALS